MAHTLVVIRHAKSDWDAPVGDEERPLAPRGRRQAPETGRWIAEHLDPLDLAVVSVAIRAWQTWDLVAAELPAAPPTRLARGAYTFSGDQLLDVVRHLPEHAGTVALVGHNPAVEALVDTLTGVWTRMPTSALAVVAMTEWAAGTGQLRAAGRPADGVVRLTAPPA